jgi:hypothetical protein
LEAAGRGIAADSAAPNDVKSEHQSEGRALTRRHCCLCPKSYTSELSVKLRHALHNWRQFPAHQ